jgi:ubiquinone/menaquinone biosynthesis C-methylase UbiE
MYSKEPTDKYQFTHAFDRAYTRFARLYDVAVKWFPLWRNWISHALHHIQGPRVLEISFGTGYLLTRYADRYRTFGVDYNWELTRVAKSNLRRTGTLAAIQVADVENLPYRSKSFDSVVNTMSFSGYPDGERAMGEIHRVLKEGGKLVMVDVNYPAGRNLLGMVLTRFWAATGDIIRDMSALFESSGFIYSDEEVGGWGSVHLYVATKEKTTHSS